MARGKYLSLEEARRTGRLDEFAKEHPSVGDWDRFDRLFEAMARGEFPGEMAQKVRLRSGDCFVVIDGKLRIAHEQQHNDDGSITADLYRNLSDYEAGRVMEPGVKYWR